MSTDKKKIIYLFSEQPLNLTPPIRSDLHFCGTISLIPNHKSAAISIIHILIHSLSRVVTLFSKRFFFFFQGVDKGPHETSCGIIINPLGNGFIVRVILFKVKISWVYHSCFHVTVSKDNSTFKSIEQSYKNTRRFHILKLVLCSDRITHSYA